MNENTPQINYETQLPTSTLAIVSMVAGIAGFTIFPAVGTIVALIAGYAARKETRAVPPVASGDGLATAGIIMGWVQVGRPCLVSALQPASSRSDSASRGYLQASNR